MALSLSRFACKNVTSKRFPPLDFARRGDFEALRGASAAFHLWHDLNPFAITKYSV